MSLAYPRAFLTEVSLYHVSCPHRDKDEQENPYSDTFLHGYAAVPAQAVLLEGASPSADLELLLRLWKRYGNHWWGVQDVRVLGQSMKGIYR